MNPERLETGWGPEAPPGDNLLQAVLENFARTAEYWPVAGVEWVATLPECRRRGYGAALTWTAATSWPGKPAYLIASDEGRKVYERIGFLALFRFTLWRIPASSRSAATGR